MLVQALTVALLLGVALLPLGRWLASRLPPRMVWAGWALCLLTPAGLVFAGLSPWRAPDVDRRPPSDRPIQVRSDGYASSKACHPDQYASWWHSDHRSMTQVAGPEASVAPTPTPPGATRRTWARLPTT